MIHNTFPCKKNKHKPIDYIEVKFKDIDIHDATEVKLEIETTSIKFNQALNGVIKNINIHPVKQKRVNHFIRE